MSIEKHRYRIIIGAGNISECPMYHDDGTEGESVRTILVTVLLLPPLLGKRLL